MALAYSGDGASSDFPQAAASDLHAGRGASHTGGVPSRDSRYFRNESQHSSSYTNHYEATAAELIGHIRARPATPQHSPPCGPGTESSPDFSTFTGSGAANSVLPSEQWDHPSGSTSSAGQSTIFRQRPEHGSLQGSLHGAFPDIWMQQGLAAGQLPGSHSYQDIRGGDGLQAGSYSGGGGGCGGHKHSEGSLIEAFRSTRLGEAQGRLADGGSSLNGSQHGEWGPRDASPRPGSAPVDVRLQSF